MLLFLKLVGHQIHCSVSGGLSWLGFRKNQPGSEEDDRLPLENGWGLASHLTQGSKHFMSPTLISHLLSGPTELWGPRKVTGVVEA